MRLHTFEVGPWAFSLAHTSSTDCLVSGIIANVLKYRRQSSVKKLGDGFGALVTSFSALALMGRHYGCVRFLSPFKQTSGLTWKQGDSCYVLNEEKVKFISLNS